MNTVKDSKPINKALDYIKDIADKCVRHTLNINSSLYKPTTTMKATKLHSISKKLARIVFTLTTLLIWAVNLLGVVPTVDSIKFVELNQANIIVYLSVDVVYAHSDPLPDANWVVYHDGNAYPVVATDNQGGLDPANIVRLKLPTAISYSEAHTGTGITVEFLGGAGLITNGPDDLASFGPTPAINDLPMECEMFDQSKFDYSLSLTEICAPVEVKYTAAYYVQSHYINSQNYKKNLITIRTYWGDGTSNETYGAEVSPGKFELTFNHVYPDNPAVCYWQSYMAPGIGGVGYCSGGGLRKNFTYENHSTDDEGDGVYTLDIDTIRICLGQDFSEFFTDNTYFNCNPQTEPDFANDGERYVRFTYGSNFSGEPRIQNILVDGNPLVAPLVGGFIIYDSIRSTGIPAPSGWGISDDISHAYSTGTDAVGQVFEIMMENWGPCNDINLGEDPIITYAYIKIVDGPIADAGPDDAICEGDNAPMAGQILRTATAGFWDTSTGDGSFTNATSPGGAVYSPGANDIVNGGVWLVLHAEDPLSGCPEHVDSMYLTIDPLPAKPTITRTGPAAFCFGEGPVQLQASASPNGDYDWFRNGTLQGAFTTQNITLDQVAQTGSWTVIVHGLTANACPSPPSDPVAITIYQLASATNPQNRTICEDSRVETGNTSFSVTVTGAARTMQWQRSDDVGVSWVDITNTTVPADGCNYSDWDTDELSIVSADYGQDGFQYRLKMTTTAGGCETFSNPGILTVNPVPDVDTHPSNTTICEFDNTTFAVVASIDAGSIASYQWRHNNVNLNAGNNPDGVYSNWDTPTLVLTSPSRSLHDDRHLVIMFSDQGCRERTNNRRLYIDNLADITTQPEDEEICNGDNASFSVATDGDPAIIGYQWQVQTGGAGPWSDVSGGVYSGETTAALTITGVGLGLSTNNYRVILTTSGPCPRISDPASLTVNPNPSASINPGSPSELCNGDVINFDGQPSGGTGGYTHSWTGDTGPLDATNAVDPDFTAPVLGSQNTYNLTYTVTDSKACVGTDNVAVVVNPVVTVNVTSSLAEVCSGGTINLDGDPNGGTGAIGSVWTGSGSGFLNSTATATPTFTAPVVGVQTTYSFTYTATDTKGCDAVQTITINVNPNPSASILPAAPGELCFADVLSLNGNPSGGTGGYIHAWTGDVTPLDATNSVNPDFTAPSTGLQTSYNLTYTVQDAKSCMATDAVTLTVNPEVVSAVLTGDASICSGFSADLQVAITGGTGNYTVVLDDLVPPLTTTELNYVSGANITTGPHAAATNTYTINSVTDSKGCRATSETGSAVIVVGSVPTSAVLAGETAICLGSTTPLQVNITGGAPPYTVDFDALPNATNYISGTDIPTGALGLGTWDFNIVSVTDNCGVSISGAAVAGGNPQQITVNALPVITPTNNAAVICSDGSTDIDLATTVTGTRYSWTVADGGGVTWLAGKAPSVGNITNGVGVQTIAQNLEHAMSVPVSVDYILTSQGPLPTTCPGSGATRTVIVEPTPEAAITNSTQTLCDGAALTGMVVSSAVSHNGTPTFDMAIVATTGALGDLIGTGTALTTLSGESYPYTISGTLTNDTDEAIVIEYRVTPLLAGCSNGTVEVATVTIEPTPIAAISNDVQTLCDGATLTDMVVSNLATHSGTPEFDLTITATTGLLTNLVGTGNVLTPRSGRAYPYTISGTLTNNTNDAIVIEYRVTPLLSSCSDGTDVLATITVEPTPLATISNNTQVLCDGGTLADMIVNTAANPTGAETFDMTIVATTGVLTDLTATGLALTPVSDEAYPYTIGGTLTNNTDDVIVVQYRVIPKLAACSNGALVLATVTVEPTPVAAISNDVQTICDGASVTDMVITNEATHNGTPEFDLAISAVTGNLGGLSSTGNTLTTVSGQAYPYTISGTLTNNTDDAIVIEYQISPLLPGCGDGTDVFATVTIEPTPKAAISNAAQTICDGSALTGMVVTTAANPLGAETFNLAIVATTGNLTGLSGTGNSLTTQLGTGYPHTISGNLTNNTDDAITIEYRVTPLLAGCSNGVDVIATVSIEPTPVAAISNDVQTICDGAALTGMVVSNEATHIGTPEFDMTIVATTGNLGNLVGTGLALTTVSGQSYPYTISGTLTNNTDDAIVIEYRVIPSLPTCSDGAQVLAEVTIEPTPKATISNNAQVLCDGDALTGMVIASAANPTGAESYNLDIVATIGNLGGLTATGNALTTVTGGGYPNTISGTLTNDTDIAITVQYRVTPLLAGCSSGTVVTATVVIEPTPKAAISNNVQTLCDGATLAGMVVSNEATHNGTPEFDLAIIATTGDLTDLVATGLALTTVSGQSYPYTISGTLTNNTDVAIVVEYRVTPLLSTCSDGADVIATVTIEPTPKAAISNDLQTLCDGAALTGMTVSSAANPTGAESFDMSIVATTGNLASLTATGLALTTVSGQGYPYTIGGTLTNNTNTAIVIEYRVTPLLAGCASGVVEIAEVTIEPTPLAAISNNAQTLCDGAALTGMAITTGATHAGVPTFNLAIVATTGNLGSLTGTGTALSTISGGGYPYTISGTLTNNTDAAITIQYRVTPLLTGCISGTVVLANVTIEPTPKAAISNDLQTLCNGGVLTGLNITNLATHAGAASFDLAIVATTGSLANLAATGNALSTVSGGGYPYTIAGTLTNSTFAPIIIEYRVRPLLAGCSNGIVEVAQITINPKPNANPTPLTQTIPNGTATDITMAGDILGTTFGWRVLNPGTTNASDGGPIAIGQKIQQTLTNNGAVPISVTYRIGPAANGCTGDSVDVVITIDPSVDMIVDNVKPDICTADNTQINISSNVTGATFTWTVTDDNSLGANTGTTVGPNTGISIQDNLVNASSVIDSVIYHITPTGPAPTFILGTTQDVKVYVYPKPQGFYDNRAGDICNGSRTNIGLDSDVSGATFTWTVTDPSFASGATASGAALPIGDSITQTLVNLGTTAFTVTYHIRPTGQGAVNCPGDILDVDVIVQPTPVASITNTTLEICSDEFTDITLGASVVGSSFTYIVADPKGTGAFDGTGVIGDKIAQQLFNTTQTPVTITYAITPIGPGATACPGLTVFEAVTVDPLPITSAITGIDTVCEGTGNLVFSVVHTPEASYEWEVPAIIGSPTFGGGGLDSYAVIVQAAATAAQVTDSIWVFETNKYGCTRDTIFHPLTIIPIPTQVNIIGDAQVCALTTHGYSVPENTGSTYQWFIPPGAGFASADPTIDTVDITFGLISGQVRVIETSAGGCVTIHNPLNITVNQLPISTLNADKIAACLGDMITFTAGPAGGLNYEFFVNGASMQTGVSNIFESGDILNIDQVTVNVTSADGCEKLSMPLSITIYDPPVVTLSSSDVDNIICFGENVAFTGISATAVNYNFFLNGVSQQSGALNFWSTIGLLDGDAVHVEVLSSFGCWGGSDTIATLVNDLPVAVLSGDAIICPGDFTPLSVNVSVGVGPYDVTVDNAVPVQIGYNSGAPIPVSPLFSTTYNLVSVTDANLCTSAILTSSSGNLSGTADIIVRDTVQILTQPHDALVCESIDTSFTVGAIGDGLLYQWESTQDLGAGFTALGGATSATLPIIAPDVLVDSTWYRVRVYSSICNPEAYSDTVQLVLKYDPDLVGHPANQTICENDGTGFAVDAGLTFNPIFAWQVSYDGGTNWLTLADTAVYNGTSTDSITIISAGSRFNGYQYKAIVTGECGSATESNAATLTIDERPEILSHPADVNICEELPTSFTVDGGNTTAVNYAWEVDMGSGFVALGDTAGIYGGTAGPVLSVLDPISRFDGYEYRAVVSGICPVPQTSNPALLLVSEMPEIVTQPLDTVICENESPIFTVNAGVTSGATYAWEVSYDGGTNWLDLADTAIYTGSASNTLRLTGVPSSDDGNVYHVIVSGVCAPPVTSVPVTMIVRDRPEIITQPTDSIVCELTPALFSVDAGVTTLATYQWQVNMNDMNGFVDLGDTIDIYSGATAADLNVLLTESRFNGYQYRVMVMGACTPPQVSNTATLVVQEIPEITLEPVPEIICEEQNTFFTTASGVTTAPSYQWRVDMGSGFVDIGADTGVYSGAGTPNLFLTLVPSDYDGYLYQVEVSGVCTPEATSGSVLLTVNQLPEILDEPVNDTICEGDIATYTVNAGVTTDVEYLWQVNRVGLWEDLSNDANYAGTATNTLTVSLTTSIFNGYLYRVIVSGECTPPITSAQALLVVDERPEIITQPDDEQVCEDDDVIFVVNPGNTTIPGILWEYSTDNGSNWLDASLLAGVTDNSNDTLVISPVISGYNNHQFHAVLTGKCPALVTSDPALLTVYEKPQIDIPPADDQACEQDTVMFFVDAGPTTNPIYQWEIWNGAAWTIPPPDIYEGVDTDTMYINGIHSGIDGLQIRLRLDGICSPGQISDTAILTVYERPEVTEQPEDVTICERDSAVFGVSAGVTTAPVYKWEYFDGSLWLPATGGFFEDGTTDTLRLYGATGVPTDWTGTQLRTVISNLCGPNDTSDVVDLVVRERPEILGGPVDEETCEGIATSFSINQGVTTSPSFLWQFHNGSMWMPVTGVQYSGQGTNTLSILNPTSNMNGYGYRVLLSGACGPSLISDSVSLTVFENPEISLQPVSASVCEGADTLFNVEAGVTTNPDFNWFYNDNMNGWQEVIADGIHNGFNSNTLTVSGALFTMDNWLYRAEVSGNCGDTVTSQSAGLIVWKLPEILREPADTTTCELRNVAFSVDVGDTDAPFLQWEEFDGSDWNVLSDGGNYIGVNTTDLSVYTVDSSMTGFLYRVRIQGTCEPETLSREAVLIVESAPDIWLQPVDASICEGDNTDFTMTATGTAINYFWQVDDGSPGGFADITDSNSGVYAGWDSNTLDVAGADRNYHFNKYRVRVEGSCIPMAMSNLVILFVQNPAEIQTQPSSDTICEFENAIFSVDATGEGLSYQWQESRNNGADWSDLSDVDLYIGSQSPTLSIFSVDRTSNGFMYRVNITGACGDPATSDEITLGVETAPDILRQPVALTACENTPAGFGVDAEGTNITYRWQLNDGGGFENIADDDLRFIGADSDTLTLLSAQLSQASYSFLVTISGGCPLPATSNPVIMLVNANPVIDFQEGDAAICENGTAVFGADASGPELNYQWYVDRQDLAGFVILSDDSVHTGSNTDQILLTNIPTTQDGWQYYLDVFNACTAIQTNAVTLTVYPNPVPAITPAVPADFPNYPQICGGDILTLDGNPTSGSGTYTLHQWGGAVGPLSVIDEQLTDFMTIVKGDYSLSYTVTDSRGCKGSDAVTIENDRPNAQFVSNAIPSCGYMEVDFTNTSSADAVSYLWDFDDETTSSQKDVTHGFDNVDISGQVAYYNIEMVATSVNGCNDTAMSVVTIYPKVIAEITADPAEGCHPLQSTLISQPGGAGYNWDFGDGSPTQDGSYIAYHLYENFGTEVEVYIASLTTTSHYGCSDTKTVDITVQPIPQPNFTAIPLVQTYPDASVTFANTTKTGPWTFLWSFGDTITSTEENPTHLYADPGTYDVDFYVLNGECKDSSKTTVVINPRIPIAAFDEPIGGCNPVEVQFVNQSQWATTYLWDFGDGYVSTKENPSHSFYDMGEYTIRLQANGPGGTDYAAWTIDIWETPNVAFNSAPDSVFVKDKPVRFYNLSAGATDFSWDFGDYAEDGTASPGNFSNARDTSHIYFTEGYKDVKLVAWNEHCSDSITLPAVKVIPKGQLEFPTVFRPDPSGPNGGYVDPNDPSVDPNYANSIFFPGVNKQVDEYHLYIYNRWGEQIFQSNDINYGWDGYLRGKLAAQGVYFWKVNVVYKNGAPDTARGDITLLHKKQQ